MYKILGADQKEYGPVTADQLRQWITEGRANSQTMVQGPDSTEWKPLGNFPEFAGILPPAPAATPGAPASYAGMAGMQPNVPNYLWQAIVVTLCCCLPFGIPAIVFASQVNAKLAAGDVSGAMASSGKAKMWCWISFALGLVVNLAYVAYISATSFGALNL
jgi:hypothetical protein